MWRRTDRQKNADESLIIITLQDYVELYNPFKQLKLKLDAAECMK